MVTCHHHFQSGICNFSSNYKFHNMPKLHVPRRTRMHIFILKNTNFSLYFGKEIGFFLATISVLWPEICRKCDSGQGSAPDPAGGAHDAPPDHLVGWGADTPPHTPPHSAPLAPRCSRLRRLDRRALLTPNPGDATGNHHF